MMANYKFKTQKTSLKKESSPPTESTFLDLKTIKKTIPPWIQNPFFKGLAETK